MCRVLILDDNIRFAETLKPVFDGFIANDATVSDIASTLDKAHELARAAVFSGRPYTVFLVNQHLGAGRDGIEAMQELQKISPESATIIFTGIENHHDGLRAYQAGAFRYLIKPIEVEELTFVLNSLMRSRREEVENKWRKVFSEMMENALHQDSFTDVASVVIEHSLKLGFKRAHLFWAPKRDESAQRSTFVGIDCRGDGCIPFFSEINFHLNDKKALENLLLSHDAVFIDPGDGNKKIISEIESIGYQLPAGGWWMLPLWSGTELLGALMLDFWQTRCYLSTHERSLLDFFVRQVAITLEHAGMYSLRKRTSEETSIISYIGRQVGTSAATQNIKNLLEHIREQVGRQFDVSNFSIFLYDDVTNALNYELLYEGGKLHKEVQSVSKDGLEEYMLSQRHEINIPDVKKFIKEHDIELRGEIPHAWLGAPMQVGDKIIGGVCIKHYLKMQSFSERDKNILRAVADQVAGAVQISNFKKEEDEEHRRMQLLQRASIEMLRIARVSTDDFWYTVLTIATSDFGLGFNRALLFLTKDNSHILHGQAGIGTNSVQEAKRNWVRNKKRKYDFNSYLKDLETGHIHFTPFQKMIETVDISLDDFSPKLRTALKSGKMIELSPDEISTQSPDLLDNYFHLSTCALLPVYTGSNILGLVVVDNKHNHISLNKKTLNSLQTLLANAGLVWETQLQRAKTEDLLKANYEILSGVSHEPLQETLSRICRTARAISQADWAIIHPFKAERRPYEIEVEHIGHDGELRSEIVGKTKSKPRVGGVSRHVLKTGELVVSNVDRIDSGIGKLKLNEHHFIKTEGVKALIGVAVKDPYTQEALGILYLDYRQSHDFLRSDVLHAKSLASLAAVAVSNAHQIEELRQRKQLTVIRDIAETVGTGLDLEETMQSVLEKFHQVFENTRLCVLLYNKDLNALKFAPATLRYYKIEHPDYKDMNTFNLGSGTIACRVAKKTLLTKKVEFENIGNACEDRDYLGINYSTQSELCVSMLSKNDLLGVLVLERDQINAFEEDTVDLVKTVAQHLSIAIDRAQQSEELDFKSTVAAQTAWAADIAHEINNEVGQIRTWAYLIKNMAETGSDFQDYAQNIEDSAAVLSSVGPWSDQPERLVELDPALESVVHNYAIQKNVATEFWLEARDIFIKVNLMEFQHVFRQLVGNAARAMNTQHEKKIAIGSRQMDHRWVEITFRDCGPGITDELRLSLFQRRVKTKDKGGYGLLLARQMVEDMGGRIKILPYQKGCGAEFSIQFPIANSSTGFLEQDH